MLTYNVEDLIGNFVSISMNLPDLLLKVSGYLKIKTEGGATHYYIDDFGELEVAFEESMDGLIRYYIGDSGNVALQFTPECVDKINISERGIYIILKG